MEAKELGEETSIVTVQEDSVVAQWLGTCLVLEVPDSIPARGEENFGVRTRFL